MACYYRLEMPEGRCRDDAIDGDMTGRATFQPIPLPRNRLGQLRTVVKGEQAVPQGKQREAFIEDTVPCRSDDKHITIAATSVRSGDRGMHSRLEACSTPRQSHGVRSSCCAGAMEVNAWRLFAAPGASRTRRSEARMASKSQPWLAETCQRPMLSTHRPRRTSWIE